MLDDRINFEYFYGSHVLRKIWSVNFLKLLIFFTFLALLVDCYGSNQTFAKLFFNINSSWMFVLTIIIFSIFRLKHGDSNFLSKKIQQVIKILLGIFVFISILITIWGSLSPDNYVYSLTRLNPANLTLQSFFLGCVLLINQSNLWWEKNYYWIIFSFPFLILLLAFISYFWPFDFLLVNVQEDRLVEYLQFIFLMLGTSILFFNIFKYRKQFNKIDLLFITSATLIFFFIAGDEVSWGQRIFKIETFQSFLQHNHQEENTIHNLYVFEWLVQDIYLFLGLILGGLSLLFGKKIKSNKIFPWIIPSWCLSAYFLIPAMYFLSIKKRGGFFGEWEIAELLLYSGAVIHILINAFRVKKLHE